MVWRHGADGRVGGGLAHTLAFQRRGAWGGLANVRSGGRAAFAGVNQ